MTASLSRISAPAGRKYRDRTLLEEAGSPLPGLEEGDVGDRLLGIGVVAREGDAPGIRRGAGTPGAIRSGDGLRAAGPEVDDEDLVIAREHSLSSRGRDRRP